MNYVKKIVNKIYENIVMQSIVALILLLPVIATLGQYISSGFIAERTMVAILYWPGVSNEFRIMLPVFSTIGIMLISYVIGITFMYRRRTLVKVIVIGLVSMALAQLVGSVFNSFTGWHEMQSFNSIEEEGVINRKILSLWHDPVWEEIVFTGIPLIILNFIKNKTSEKMYKIETVVYFVIPSVAMVMYHVPNHGLARIPDTLISHAVSSWLALRYSFFAPLVLHYVEDAFMIISLDKIKGVPINEINWIAKNSYILNDIFAISLISFLVLMPILSIWYLRKEEKIKDNHFLRWKVILALLLIFLLIGFYIANNLS